MNIILIYAYNNYKNEEFLNQLNNKGIKKDTTKKLYLRIISDYGEEYKEFVDHSVNFICSDKTDTNFEDTINILRQLKNNDQALFLYFNNVNISIKAIKEINLKKSSITSSFRFLSLLVENLFFEDTIKEKLKNSGYYHLTISNINGMLNKYQNLDFDYNETLD